MSEADKEFPVRMDEGLPEGMHVGDPVIDQGSGIEIGTIAGREEVRNLDQDHRIVMVRIEQAIGERQREPVRFSVPVKVSRQSAEQMHRRIKATAASELTLILPRSSDRLTMRAGLPSEESGKTTIITSEHVSHARELFDRMDTAGMLEMPPEVTPGDKIYGDDVVIGRVALLEEIEKVPEGQTLRYLDVPETEEDGPYTIPVLIDSVAAAPVGERAARERRDVALVVWCSQTDKPLGMPITAAHDSAGHRIEATHPGPMHPDSLTVRMTTDQAREALSDSMGDRDVALEPERFFTWRRATRQFASADAECDFDGSQPVMWSYPCKDFVYQPKDARQKAWPSEGAWAACQACSRVIEKGDWDELLKRHMRARQDEIDVVPLARQSYTVRWLRELETGILQAFREHRSGPREPVFPEAYVKLPTSSPLAQIAFGEQLKLLRHMQTPDARRWIAGWVKRTRGPLGLDELTAEQRQAFVDYSVVPLRYGETFFWAGDICRMIGGAAEALGKDTPWTLLRESIPAASGFFYCDRPIAAGPSAPLRAIAWTVTYGGEGWTGNIHIDAHGRGNPETASGIMLSCYRSNENGALRPDGFYYWRFNDDHVKAASYALQFDSSLNIDDVEWQRMALFATMLAFVQQKIIVASRPFTPDRATRKQAERERPEREPILRIIELRRRQRVGYEPPSDHKIIDWKWQWRVRPFWRQQWYPSMQIHQPKYIDGFWKGPADAPIKPPTRIFVVDQ